MAKRSTYQYKTYGYNEMLNQMAKAGQNVVGVAKEMCEVPAYTITQEIKKQMEDHRVTGDTYKAIVDPTGNAEFTGTKVISRFGFDMTKPNVAIVYMEKGTPKRKPIKIIGEAVRMKYKTCKKQQEMVIKYWFDKPYDPNYYRQNRRN